MRKIEFKQGGHQWLIVVDDVDVYSLTLDKTDLVENTKERYKYNLVAKDIIFYMCNDLDEYSKTGNKDACVISNPIFNREELNYLEIIIGETLYYYLGV